MKTTWIHGKAPGNYTPLEVGACGARRWLMDSPLLPYEDDTPGVASTGKPAYGLQ